MPFLDEPSEQRSITKALRYPLRQAQGPRWEAQGPRWGAQGPGGIVGWKCYLYT